MRHSAITLAMDTYGHLFPVQEADAVAQLEAMTSIDTEGIRATGTDDSPEGAQQLGSETTRRGAKGNRRIGNPSQNLSRWQLLV